MERERPSSLIGDKMKGILVVLGFFALIYGLVRSVFDLIKFLKGKNMNKMIIVVWLMSLVGCGMEQVEEGSRGIKTKWGKVTGEPLTPGFYFYEPISTDVFEMSVREQKAEGKEPTFTRDTQLVDVSYTVTFYPKPDKIGALFSQFGKDWQNVVVPQVIVGSLKDTIGQYIADDLVSKRDAARTAALIETKKALEERDVIVTRLDFTNLDFDDAYEHAVEAKVVAVQRASESKNKTVQVQEEAKQKILQATADAEAMKIKTKALSENRSLVDYEAVQKWDGKLPQYILGGNTMPFINLNKKGN